MKGRAVHFKVSFLIICLLASIWGKAFSAEDKPESAPPVVQAVMCSTPPVIDGKLDDPCWVEAYKSEDFWRVDKGEPSPERTRIYICYDKEALYVAFYCFHSQPGKIKAMQKKRGGIIREDDFVEIGLDTYHTRKECYWFDITAGGTQRDRIPGGSGTKVEWRGDWKGVAKIVGDGWTAEMAIPWKILRFPRKTTVMGICAGRNIPYRDIWVVWPNLVTRWNLEKMADLVGLELPEVRRLPVVIPYVLGIAQEGNKREISAGLNMKQSFTSGLTATFTLNPDFKTIENEVESIDFSYTELYISDRRPFFTEGEGFFPSSTMFYTRRIEDIDAGIKLFGRVGKAKVGILDAFDIKRRNDLSGKLSYDFTTDSGIWIGGVHTSKIDSSNANLGFGAYYDYRKERGGSYYSEFTFLRTVVGGRKGNISSVHFGRWPGRGMGGFRFWVDFEDVEEGYTSWTAFIPEKNYWRVGVRTGYRKRYDEGLLRYCGTRLYVQRVESHADTLMYQGISFGGNIGIRRFGSSGANVGLSYYERPPNIARTVYWGLSGNGDDIYQGGDLGVSFGRKAGADYLYMNLNQGYRATEDLSFKLRGELRRMREPSEEVEYRELVVLTGNYDITSEHGVGFRAVYRYDFTGGLRLRSVLGKGDLNVCLTYRQAVRSGMDIYLILGDPNAERTQKRLAIKLLRPLF